MNAAITLDQARRVLAAQPFNDLVGAQLTEFADGVAILELVIEDRHRQQHGLVHGGVLAYLADNALTFAAGSLLGSAVVTTSLTIHYLRAARGGSLTAKATVTHRTSRRAVCTVDLVAVAPRGETDAIAIATGTAAATGTTTR